MQEGTAWVSVPQISSFFISERFGLSCTSQHLHLLKRLERCFGHQGWDFSIACASECLAYTRHCSGWTSEQTQSCSSTHKHMGIQATHGGIHMQRYCATPLLQVMSQWHGLCFWHRAGPSPRIQHPCGAQLASGSLWLLPEGEPEFLAEFLCSSISIANCHGHFSGWTKETSWTPN